MRGARAQVRAPAGYAGGFFLSVIGTVQAIDCQHNVWSLKDINQSFKEPLIIVRPGL
jgi:hypothetical protein